MKVTTIVLLTGFLTGCAGAAIKYFSITAYLVVIAIAVTAALFLWRKDKINVFRECGKNNAGNFSWAMMLKFVVVITLGDLLTNAGLGSLLG